MTHEIAIIYWTDATIHGGDARTREGWGKIARLMTGVAVGHIVQETQDTITLAMDFFNETDELNETYRVVSTYPKSGISKIIRQTIEV